MQKKNRIKVLLVDDQPLFVYSLANVIKNRASDIEIIGIEENGEKAIEFIEIHQPDIIIMDIKMPVLNGVEAARIISEKHPEIKMMMLTTFDEDAFVFEALKYGAKGYLLKNILPEEVITAIRALYAGIDQISPSIISRLTEKMNPMKDKNSTQQKKTISIPHWFIVLTRLEKEILEQVVQGMTNKEIASSQNLAEQTVKNYLSNIYGKMDVHKRSQVVKKYMDDKIIDFKND